MVILAASLIVLSYRWQAVLADVIATAVTADAALTLVQAIVYDLPRRHWPLDLIVIAIAISVPTIAAILL